MTTQLNFTIEDLREYIDIGDIETLQKIINTGIDVNGVNGQDSTHSWACTPLLYAINRNDRDVVKFLLRNGADPNKSTAREGPPICIAAKRPVSDILQILLDAGANPNMKDKSGTYPIHYAIQYDINYLRVLIDSGADLNVTNDANWTPLHFALNNRDKKSVEMLINAGADVNTKNRKHDTPLHIAASLFDIDILKLLLNAGADVNAENLEGRIAYDYINEEVLDIIDKLRKNS